MESNQKFRIALDAMGGDYAPHHEVAGALEVIRAHNSKIEVVFVGDEKAIRAELAKQNAADVPVTIVHASQVITMDDSPTAAIKQKKDSSLAVGVRLQGEGKVVAFVSAGNTGAVLSAATLILGRIKGVSRPTIGTFIPAETGTCLLIDAGANVDCRAQHLFEFAIMGSIYAKFIYKKENPKVALLNVGEEKSKGTEEVLDAYKMLSQSKINFIGNVEGRDILKAKADVVICDGFTGNILLKFGESIPAFLKARLKQFARNSFFHSVVTGIARWPLKVSLYDLDPNIYGGVPILGINGVVIIGHGSSTPTGIKNMILRAAEVAEVQLNRHIELALSEIHTKTIHS